MLSSREYSAVAEEKKQSSHTNITELQSQHKPKDREDKTEEEGRQEKGGRKSTATGITL